jgi:GT2 family glycosyltransferase
VSARAAVVIPTYNRIESLRRTLDALRAQSEAVAVTVVDNGSADGTVGTLAADYPEVRVEALPANLGFGAAVNRGIAATDAPLVLLLNNDTVVPPDFVATVVDAQERTGAAMVACCLRSPDGPIESLGVEVDRALVAYDVWHGEPYERAMIEVPPEPLAPSGGAAAFARAALDEVGGFDEHLFAYLEDVELGIRMRLAGFSCAVEPAAFAWHEHSATLGSGTGAKNRLMGRSRAYLMWKYGGAIDRPARLRGWAIDAAVYSGQIAIDRNAGALRGRLAERRRLAGAPRPSAPSAFDRVPRVERPVGRALRMRLARRRP